MISTEQAHIVFAKNKEMMEFEITKLQKNATRFYSELHKLWDDHFSLPNLVDDQYKQLALNNIRRTTTILNEIQASERSIITLQDVLLPKPAQFDKAQFDKVDADNLNSELFFLQDKFHELHELATMYEKVTQDAYLSRGIKGPKIVISQENDLGLLSSNEHNPQKTGRFSPKSGLDPLLGLMSNSLTPNRVCDAVSYLGRMGVVINAIIADKVARKCDCTGMVNFINTFNNYLNNYRGKILDGSIHTLNNGTQKPFQKNMQEKFKQSTNEVLEAIKKTTTGFSKEIQLLLEENLSGFSTAVLYNNLGNDFNNTILETISVLKNDIQLCQSNLNSSLKVPASEKPGSTQLSVKPSSAVSLKVALHSVSVKPTVVEKSKNISTDKPENSKFQQLRAQFGEKSPTKPNGTPISLAGQASAVPKQIKAPNALTPPANVVAVLTAATPKTPVLYKAPRLDKPAPFASQIVTANKPLSTASVAQQKTSLTSQPTMNSRDIAVSANKTPANSNKTKVSDVNNASASISTNSKTSLLDMLDEFDKVLEETGEAIQKSRDLYERLDSKYPVNTRSVGKKVIQPQASGTTSSALTPAFNTKNSKPAPKPTAKQAPKAAVKPTTLLSLLDSFSDTEKEVADALDKSRKLLNRK